MHGLPMPCLLSPLRFDFDNCGGRPAQRWMRRGLPITCVRPAALETLELPAPRAIVAGPRSFPCTSTLAVGRGGGSMGPSASWQSATSCGRDAGRAPDQALETPRGRRNRCGPAKQRRRRADDSAHGAAGGSGGRARRRTTCPASFTLALFAPNHHGHRQCPRSPSDSDDEAWNRPRRLEAHQCQPICNEPLHP